MKKGPITIDSRVRDTISCVFLPQTVAANSVHCEMRLQTALQHKVYYQNTPTLETRTPPCLARKYPKHANDVRNRVGTLLIQLPLLDSGPLIHFSDVST